MAIEPDGPVVVIPCCFLVGSSEPDASLFVGGRQEAVDKINMVIAKNPLAKCEGRVRFEEFKRTDIGEGVGGEPCRAAGFGLDVAAIRVEREQVSLSDVTISVTDGELSIRSGTTSLLMDCIHDYLSRQLEVMGEGF